MNIKEFMRRIALNNDLSYELREYALDYLVSDGKSAEHVILTSVETSEKVIVTRVDYANLCSLMRANQKIEAIKYLRELAGKHPTTNYYTLGLRDAKVLVESIPV